MPERLAFTTARFAGGSGGFCSTIFKFLNITISTTPLSERWMELVRSAKNMSDDDEAKRMNEHERYISNIGAG